MRSALRRGHGVSAGGRGQVSQPLPEGPWTHEPAVAAADLELRKSGTGSIAVGGKPAHDFQATVALDDNRHLVPRSESVKPGAKAVEHRSPEGHMRVVIVDEQHVVRHDFLPSGQRRRRRSPVAHDHLPVGDLTEVLNVDPLAIDEDPEVVTAQTPHALPLAILDDDLEVDHADVDLLAEDQLRRRPRFHHLGSQRRTEHRNRERDQEREPAPSAVGQRPERSDLPVTFCGRHSFSEAA